MNIVAGRVWRITASDAFAALQMLSAAGWCWFVLVGVGWRSCWFVLVRACPGIRGLLRRIEVATKQQSCPWACIVFSGFSAALALVATAGAGAVVVDLKK